MAAGARRAASSAAMREPSCSLSSSSSGRERRRVGKKNMLATIAELRSLIAERDAQLANMRDIIDSLLAEVAQLARNRSDEPLPLQSTQDLASTADGLFNVYDYEEDEGAFVEAGTQTDISVCHQYPDVFVRLPQSTPSDVSASWCAADAAAGASPAPGSPLPIAGIRMVTGPTPPILAETGVGSPRTTPSTPGSSNPGSSRCAAKDFSFQNLAKTVEPLDEPCETLVDGHSMLDSDDQGLTAHATRRAFDAISEDAVSTLMVFNSQDLACTSAFFPGAEAVASAAAGSIGVGSPRTTPSTPGSSNPGSSSCAVVAAATLLQIGRVSQAKSAKLNVENDSSYCVTHCDDKLSFEQCGPLPERASHTCGLFSRPSGSDTELEDFDSYNLASQCGPLPARLSPELLDAKSSDSNAQLCTFSSQTLANAECALGDKPMKDIVNADGNSLQPDFEAVSRSELHSNYTDSGIYCPGIDDLKGINSYHLANKVEPLPVTMSISPGGEAVASPAPDDASVLYYAKFTDHVVLAQEIQKLQLSLEFIREQMALPDGECLDGVLAAGERSLKAANARLQDINS